MDRDVDTDEIGEVYMVATKAWPLEPRGGMLCVGCLEVRIGRRLTPAVEPVRAAVPGLNEKLTASTCR